MKKPSLHVTNSDIDRSFRFDSRDCPSKSKSKMKSKFGDNIDLNLSQRTSQVVRFAQGTNQNILELLEESEEENKIRNTQKKQGRRDLWDFFARFEKQSNPDITISQIQVPIKKQINKPNLGVPKRKSEQSKHFQDQVSYREQFMFSSNHDLESSNTNSRYPKRNRFQPFKYWMGERYKYQNGKIVDIIKAAKREHDQ